MKTTEKELAISLRREGFSMNEIALRLDVSKSSVSLWTRDVELPSNCKGRLGKKRTVQEYANNGKGAARVAREKRQTYQDSGAERFIAGDKLFMMGCMLYWCEGQKSKNAICFSNADPDVISVFIRFLRDSMAVAEEKIKLRIHAYLNNGILQSEIEEFWLKTAGLSRVALHKGTYDVYSRSSARKKRNLLYGTAHITVCSTVKLHEIYGGIATMCSEKTKFLF